MNINWFKKEIEPFLSDYEVKHKFYKNGDLGDLNQIEFNSKKMGGEIDFWSSGWISVHLVDYLSGKELINILLKPEQLVERDKLLKEFSDFLELY